MSMWPSELGVFNIRIIHEILFPGSFTLSWAPGCGTFSFPEILPGGRRPVSWWECECVKQFFSVLHHPKAASFRPGQGDMVGNRQKTEVFFALTNIQASLGAGHHWLFSKILEKHGWAWSWCLPTWVRSENPVPTRGGVVVLDSLRVLPWIVHDSGWWLQGNSDTCWGWGYSRRWVGTDSSQSSCTLLTYLQFGKR